MRHFLIIGIKGYKVDLFTEDKIKEGFKKDDYSFLSGIYKSYYPTVKRFVLNNAGSEEDAKDLLQEALMVVFLKIKDDEFELKCSFLTYVYSIVKNLWLKELRAKKTNGIIVKDVENIEDVDCHVNFEKEYNLNVEYFIFRMHFNQLGKTCKQILKMFLERITYDEIAKILDLKSGGVVRRRKFRCKEVLIEMIKNDSRYVEKNK